MQLPKPVNLPIKSTMTTISVFEFESQEIRFVDGKPVANDIATVLGYADPSKTVSTKVDPENRTVTKTVTVDGKSRGVTVLEEAGIYQLIFGSKMESAKKFQKWVFIEVLPSIRETGKYDPVQPSQRSLPSGYIEALKALVVAEEEKARLEEANQQLTIAAARTEKESAYLKAEITVLAPKAESFDVYVNSDGWLNGEQIAKQMAIPKLSVRKLYDILREEKVIFKRAGDGVNIPCQKWVDQGLAKLRDIKCPDNVMRRGLVFHRKAFDRILDVLRDRGLVPAGRDYAIVIESNVVPLKRAEA